MNFDFESRKEFVRITNFETGEIEEKPTGGFIFENEWQSFRTKQNRELEFTTVEKDVTTPAKIAVKVVDIFGNDTIKW